MFSDPPDIEVDQSWITTSDGIEAEVSCNIHAEPRPEVSSIEYLSLRVLSLIKLYLMNTTSDIFFCERVLGI